MLVEQYRGDTHGNTDFALRSIDTADPKRVEKILHDDSYILINPKNNLSSKLDIKNSPMRVERTVFEKNYGSWVPLRIARKGGHSTILLAVNAGEQRLGCVKVSRYVDDKEADSRRNHEVKVVRHMQDVKHLGGIIRVYDTVEDNYAVYDYVEGYPLDEMLNMFPLVLGQKGAERVIRRACAAQICQRVATCWGNKVTHNDLKLENFMMSMAPNGPKITLLDFEHAEIHQEKIYSHPEAAQLVKMIFIVLTGRPSHTDTDNISTQEAIRRDRIDLTDVGIDPEIAADMTQCLTGTIDIQPGTLALLFGTSGGASKRTEKYIR